MRSRFFSTVLAAMFVGFVSGCSGSRVYLSDYNRFYDDSLSIARKTNDNVAEIDLGSRARTWGWNLSLGHDSIRYQRANDRDIHDLNDRDSERGDGRIFFARR